MDQTFRNFADKLWTEICTFLIRLLMPRMACRKICWLLQTPEMILLDARIHSAWVRSYAHMCSYSANRNVTVSQWCSSSERFMNSWIWDTLSSTTVCDEMAPSFCRVIMPSIQIAVLSEFFLFWALKPEAKFISQMCECKKWLETLNTFLKMIVVQSLYDMKSLLEIGFGIPYLTVDKPLKLIFNLSLDSIWYFHGRHPNSLKKTSAVELTSPIFVTGWRLFPGQVSAV